MKFSLWVVPPVEVHDRLARVIFKLSATYQSPTFEPHLTLLGDIPGNKEQVVLKTAELAKQIRPFTVQLTKIDFLDTYFRCIFVRVVEIEDLMKANQKAREIFQRQEDPSFMPHVSLLYGNFPQIIKEKAIQEIKDELSLEFSVQDIHLVASSSRIPVEDWEYVKKFSF